RNSSRPAVSCRLSEASGTHRVGDPPPFLGAGDDGVRTVAQPQLHALGTTEDVAVERTEVGRSPFVPVPRLRHGDTGRLQAGLGDEGALTGAGGEAVAGREVTRSGALRMHSRAH